MLNLSNKKNEQTLNSLAGLSNDVNLSPNLYSQHEVLENQALLNSKKHFILLSKVVVSLLLLGYLASLLILQFQIASSHNLALSIDRKIEELENQKATAQKVQDVNNRLTLHRDISTKHKNLSGKITAILNQIQTNDDLLSFEFADKKLVFEIAREEVLDVSGVLEKILAKDFVEEVAILEASLNTTDNKYIIKMEVVLK